MAARDQRPVVAELGRPETPDETAARKAETSRRHRANQTLLNLVVALIGSLLIVVFLVTVVVRPTPETANDDVDYATIAAQAQPQSDEPLVSPVLPEGWTANDARFQQKQQVPTWYIGFLTPQQQYIGLDQGIGANPSWQAALLQNAAETGTVTIEGVEWTVYNRRDAQKTGNYAYSLATVHDESTVLLHGSAADDEFMLLATAIAAQWEAEG